MTGTLLRDLIEIPERVQTNDFVLRLSEGVSAEGAAATVANYVVTPQLAKAFDHALGFVKGAVEGRRSAASYLHGSFGSGKSHFMAVLDLVLAGDVRARSLDLLAPVLNRHDPWLEGKRFLMVPFHMIGARSVESAVLGGYAEHVRKLHPDAPIPAFYLGERLFEDARGLIARMGEDPFFDGLNEGSAVDEGWGELGSAWDRRAFEAATLEAATGLERQRLVADLIRVYFPSYVDISAATGEAFVDFDTGLAIMSAHARGLGYDAVILFLDELILWLASRAGDVDFVAAEGAKLSKLVEAQRADRLVPIISFVARQRDLRELIGEHQAGALEMRFIDTLRYWEARFDQITLEDRNLPVIAQRRLLRPRSEAARQELDAAFDSFAGARREVFETLLGSDGERSLFRMVYPFSPALVDALIAASSVLQRERTALKLMLTLLVKRRDELRLGDLIPVGDLWDEIAAGDQPFSDGMRLQFDNARRLWTQKLLPMLEAEHGVAWQELQEGGADAEAARRFRNDARLLKTLLLAALVPETPALKALTPQRLAALNHGAVTSPIPGRDGAIVQGKLRNWAARVGEIKVGEEASPTVSLQITGVDIEPILANAALADNDGTRRSRIKRIVFEALGVQEDTGLLGAQPFAEYEHPWRGTRRKVDLYFESVLDMSDERLRGRPGAPVLVLGMPFDPKGHAPIDHLARARNFQADGGSGGVVWQPSFLSDRALKDVGALVRIDYLLAGAGDRLADAARMLSLTDREQARAVLKNRQSALHQQLRLRVEAAYGLRADPDGIGSAVPPEDQIVSLDAFTPPRPIGAGLKEAVSDLLDKVFAARFPAHPLFEQDIRPQNLRKVLEEVKRAAVEPNQRVFVEDRATRQLLLAIAKPLSLGESSQTHFMLSTYWADHFARCHAQDGAAEPMTVRRLRQWMDRPRAMGLTEEAANLVVLAFAAQADRTLIRNGAPASASLDRIDDAVELREQPLPDVDVWERARERAGALFGLAVGEVRKGATVADLATRVAEKAAELRPRLIALANALTPRMAALGLASSTARAATLRSAQLLLSDLAAAEDSLEVVAALARAELLTSEAAVARCLGAASGRLSEALNSISWDILDAASALSDDRRRAAEAIRLRLTEVLEADEHAVQLEPALRELQTRASRLLAEASASAVPRPTPVTPAGEAPRAPEPTAPGDEVIEEQQAVDLVAADAEALLADLRARVASRPGVRLSLSWRLTRSERDGTR